MKRAKVFNKGIYLFMKYTAGVWFKIFYPVKITNPEIIKEMKAPYLLLPNHIMMWDSAILTILFPDPLHCMGSESHFRKPIVGFLLSLIGIFPKAKAKSDLGAIRHMMDLKNKKKNICVYPEGQMSWDGGSMPLFYSTAKLIKLLKIPVYVPIFAGGSAVYPRWGTGKRKGPMELTIHPLFTDSKEIKALDPDSIFEKLEKVLNYQDMDLTIPERGWVYKSEKKAEYLEDILFICPSCRGIATLKSQGNSISCTSCGYKGTLDDQYQFSYKDSEKSESPAAGHKTIMEWNKWQEKVLPQMLASYKAEDSERPFMLDTEIEIKTGFRMAPLQIWTKKGSMALFKDHVMLKPEKGDIRLIPFDEMNGVHVMTRKKLEFYHEKTLYVFFFPDQRISGYKWLCAFRKLGIPSSYAWHGEEVEKI
ncbi:lysophospholipid acyltransferase family protein [Oceanispirochaeta sp. M2]|uniref:lysophospholipid acyltransferase family protein n=1 Tax=Oceanispirochaeta sp. M2 TaxID=2735869 RepID=UPI0015568946|nr:1-acyl-sn-glycerol-3-phosphate acyltransferase [Oceanispirochaeta sp. M2]